jgi:hypothetical protein
MLGRKVSMFTFLSSGRIPVGRVQPTFRPLLFQHSLKMQGNGADTSLLETDTVAFQKVLGGRDHVALSSLPGCGHRGLPLESLEVLFKRSCHQAGCLQRLCEFWVTELHTTHHFLKYRLYSNIF